MNDRVEAAPAGIAGGIEQPIHQRGVSNVALDQTVVVAIQKWRHVGAFARRVVEIVEVVEHGDALAATEQTLDQMGADETGTTGHQDMGCHMSTREGSGSEPQTLLKGCEQIGRGPCGVGRPSGVGVGYQRSEPEIYRQAEATGPERARDRDIASLMARPRSKVYP